VQARAPHIPFDRGAQHLAIAPVTRNFILEFGVSMRE
jgi:hypothetical protein